jgi:hypothetical protein
MRTLVLVGVLIVLAVPVAALAKGPSSASISGPGISRTLAVAGDGEVTGNALGNLTQASGFFAQMYGQTPDPTLASRPTVVALGPRYKVVYIVPGPNAIRSRVVQWVYPFAKGGPLTYMKSGQRFWGERKAHGGWFRAPGLAGVLRQIGLRSAARS